MTDWKRRFIYTGFLLLMMAGCSREQATWDDLPVVEGYLIPGRKIEVKVTQKDPYNPDINRNDVDLNALQVWIEGVGEPLWLTAAGNGIYSDSFNQMPVHPDSTYYLHLVYEEKEAGATTKIPYKPLNFKANPTSISFEQRDPENPGFPSQTDPVVLSWTNTDTSYYLITFTCIDPNPVSVIKDSLPGEMGRSFEPMVRDTLELQPMMFTYFGKTRVILYHINPEYVSFFNTWMSNSQNYEEPPSNVTNGLGIFTGIHSDTCLIDVIQAK